MTFVQILEYRTSRADELFALDKEWEQATEGKRTARRSVITRDRNDPERYLIIVSFDSYESAMENSQLPETQEFAAKYAEFVEGPLVFHDLDVIDERLG
jgi:quinol monooxygenase YgiN